MKIKTFLLFYVSMIINTAIGFNSSQLDSKIVKGVQVIQASMRHMASIRILGKHFCNGFVSSRRLIITTATCVHHIDVHARPDLSVVTVLLASTILTAKRVKVYPIQRADTHPNYNTSEPIKTSGYDIGYLLLAREISNTPVIRSIPVSKKEPKFGTEGDIAGWGAEKFADPTTPFHEVVMSNVLKKMHVKIVSKRECSTAYPDYVIGPTQMCGSGMWPGESAAWGDEGSPLVKARLVIGIVSRVNRIGGKPKPTLFIKANHFYDYIEEKKILHPLSN